ncbi:thiamine-phosphate kinase [Coxiella endosymbiont of Amblyomma nuttalli]|uniref:thiamine-phosphate kinase n=1 Tax=Coxiella endosymbiont of Amblyomma nuttalli TaxID=2749996 RepID=UPI001BA7B4C5|nr:thiamine-phosphate kinase [Coxiella endosymbiont of Amblyomma nuttalli]QTS83688.1 Thiamine-monophosphate kinase [Coxiella endosymbiont of Amblyomma nuttalli]
MSISEFEIIEKYFQRHQDQSARVLVGIGDDTAVIEIPEEKLVATSMDTLVEGVHFLVNTLPKDLGHKVLAVNLSDLAAMGAQPDMALLALTLKKVDEAWLNEFAEGFFSLADKYGIVLIGGDITAGTLSISVVINGLISRDDVICRNGAKVRDLIYVTGTLGDAGLALSLLNQGEKIDSFLFNRLNRPTPRIEVGLALRKIASAAIDISDGLIADLEKMTTASQVGAEIYVDQLPLSKSLRDRCTIKTACQYALTSGDDYELCFTVPPERRDRLKTVFKSLDCEWRCIGEITIGKGVTVIDSQNNRLAIGKKGYEHF